ncbi:MAG: hypothetical protein GY696_06415 [Gammaproteobacteria bacterium]|nr:hypothetical protein [Gammaproteobacteria bacterium]
MALSPEVGNEGLSIRMMRSDRRMQRSWHQGYAPIYIGSPRGNQGSGPEGEGWLRDWGDMFALVCIILCLLEAATRVSVAFGRGLRVTGHVIKHYLENRRHQRCPAGAWQRRIFEPEEGPATVAVASALDILPQANLN